MKRSKPSKMAQIVKEHKAPLVEVDPLELTDKRLNPEESVAKEREELLAIEAKKKIVGQKELEDVERASGPRIQWADLIARLQKLNPNIRVKDGVEGSVALYLKKRPEEYTPADLSRFEVPPNGQFFIDHKYVTGFPKQPLAEWSTVTVDTSHVAHREQRSWRSVLLSFIKQRAFSYRAAIEEFGDPTGDVRAYRAGGWFDQMRPKFI